MSALPDKMPLRIKNENEDRLIEIRDFLSKLFRRYNTTNIATKRNSDDLNSIFHYTSYTNLFDILNGDSLWASLSRFSNDSTEDKLFDAKWLKQKQYYGDNYLICFSKYGDILSQWRGYCPHGGVSIEFRILKDHTYSLFLEDSDTSAIPKGTDVISYKNAPFSVIYSRPADIDDKNNDALCLGPDINDLPIVLEEIVDEGKTADPPKTITEADILPFLKNGYFFEERELRLVFDNTSNSLEKCVRFRKDADGSRLPYIVVKYGNLLDAGRDLRITYTDDEISDIFKRKLETLHSKDIEIPCGYNQETVCRAFSEKIINHKKDIYGGDKTLEIERWERRPIRILCDGHLPILSITVSPSSNQEHMKEVIERFCRSRYWLQNVEVKCSQIPYIAPRV